MSIPQRPDRHPRPLRKFSVFRIDDDTPDSQHTAMRRLDLEETQEIPALETIDLEETDKHPAVQKPPRLPGNITAFPTPRQSVNDSVKLPVTALLQSLLPTPKKDVGAQFIASDPIVLPPAALPGERQTQIIDYQQRSGAIQKQKAAKKKWLSFSLRVGFTLLLFAILFKSMSWSNVQAALTHVNHATLLVGLAVGAFGLVVSSYQWRSLLYSERIHIDFAKLINLYIIGIAFSHFLPTGMGGDAVKAFYVGRDSNNTAGSASAVLMSRITGFFSMLFVALPVLVIWHAYFTREVIVGFLSFWLIVGCLIGGTVFAAILLPKLFKGPLANQGIFASAIRIGNALSMTFRRPRFLIVAILFGVLFNVVASLNYYSYALALGMNVPLHFYFVAIPLISLVAFLPISINGFGLRESAFVFVLSTIHVPPATSLLLALLMDVQVLFFGVLGGCMYFALTPSGKTKVKKQQRVA